jgi:hypothetical protein
VTTRLEDALEACLQSLSRGASVESAVSAFPDLADELRSLLQAAQAASSLASSGVSRHALVRSRIRLLQRAAAIAPARRRSLWPALARPALAGLVAAAALFLGGAGLAAAQSLPGDSLYPAKLVVEDLMLRLASSPETLLQLEESNTERRVDEVRRLLALRRVAPVSFAGEVQQVSSDGLIVSEIDVRLAPEVRLVSDVRVGSSVEVLGNTEVTGAVMAHDVLLRAFDMSGSVDSIGPETWVIAGRSVAVRPESNIVAGVSVGDRVAARVRVDHTGEMWIERAEEIAGPLPTAVPVPILPAPIATQTPMPPPQAEASPDPEPGESEPGESEETESPEPPNEGEEDNSGDSEGEELDFTGVVQSIGGSQWIVDGRVVRIDGDTEIRDDPEVGDIVRVKARLQSDGGWLAEKIEREDD